MDISPDAASDLQLLQIADHCPQAVELLAQRYTQLVRCCAAPFISAVQIQKTSSRRE